MSSLIPRISQWTWSESINIACNLNCRIEIEGLLQVAGKVTYAVKSRKWCKIEMVLLQTTNRKFMRISIGNSSDIKNRKFYVSSVSSFDGG